MLQESTLEKIKLLALPILEEMGLELVDLEFKREGRHWFLRFFIDKEGGVTLDDCADFSHDIGVQLEVEDPVSAAYRLEVSSPGLDRPLKQLKDFDRFSGQQAKIKMEEKLDPDNRGYSRKTFVGELLGLEGELIVLRQTDRKGGEIRLPYQDVEKANLEIEF